MSQFPKRTQVAIIGGGPAGSLLALLLHQQGVESVILELRTRDHVLSRVRAGVIEHGSGDILRQTGVGGRMDREGLVHEGVNFVFGDETLRIDFDGLIGKHVIIYGQSELQKDLYEALDEAAIHLADQAEDIVIDGIDTTAPRVRYQRDGKTHTLDCDFVVGCDGAHGVSRDHIPVSARHTFERLYPFVWVGLLSETAPVSDELIYVNAPEGFALCSMRNQNMSRYYLQGSADDTIEDWPDERFWSVLEERLPKDAAGRLAIGPAIEKLVTPLRSWVLEPMGFGRLFLAGDSAHVVPPTGAKGLNLAISDVVYLAEAFAGFYQGGSTTKLSAYSVTALSRVWKAVRFSWWMTATMHRFPGLSDDFDRRLQRTEFEYLLSSENAQRALAENYVGLPL